MSFGKSKTKSSQTQSGTSNTTVDPWAKSQYEAQTGGILDSVHNYTNQPFKSYTGDMVAGLSPEQQQARSLAGGAVGNWQGILGDAEGAAHAGLDFNPADVSQYYNPYESQVVDASGAYFDEQLAKNLSANGARATMSGAYGGGRQGVAEAELMRTSGMDRSKLMSDLRYKGFNDARDTGFRKQQADYQGAGILGNLAGQRQQFSQNDVGMMEQLGATSREIDQAKLLASRAEFDREAKDQLDKLLLELQARQGILGATPYGTSTTSSGTGSSSGSNTSFSGGLSFGPKGLSFGG